MKSIITYAQSIEGVTRLHGRLPDKFRKDLVHFVIKAIT